LSVLRRLIAGTDYRNENLVVVFQPGHILPGKIAATGEGTDKGLGVMGIETTMTDEAVMTVSESVSQVSAKNKIVDADLYVLFKVLEPVLSKEGQQKLAEQILEQTAEKYKISYLDDAAVDTANKPQNNGNPSNQDGGDHSGSGKDNDKNKTASINADVFGFGKPSTPPGRQKRSSSKNWGGSSAPSVGKFEIEKQDKLEEAKQAEGNKGTVKAIAAGGAHTCAIDDTGVKCWGKNGSGQTTVPTTL
jgi:hypothetical protein